MKLATSLLLGLTFVQGAKEPEDVAGLGDYCGSVFDRDKDGKEITKTYKCDNFSVCATLDIKGVKELTGLTVNENVFLNRLLGQWGLGTQAWDDPNNSAAPDKTALDARKERLDKEWEKLGEKKRQFKCKQPTLCNYSLHGVKVTCADIPSACDAECMEEKFKDMNKLGKGPNYLWEPCNIYNPNSGCRHIKEDEHACCATPVDNKPIVPERPNEMGQGSCIPVGADTTDGKVKTEAWETRLTDNSHRDKAGWRDVESADGWKAPKYAIKSQSLEFECSAQRLLATTAAVLALSSVL